MPMKKKNIITLIASIIILVIVVIITGVLWTKSDLQQKIVFANESNYNINLVKINYSEKELVLNNIQSQSTISENITANSDGYFDIKIMFSDGFEVQQNNLGYITNADGSDNIFQVTQERKLIFNQEY